MDGNGVLMVGALGATLLARSLWLGPALCFATRLSDRVFTVHNARLFKAQTKIRVEGSFEINPHSQADVDALRVLSWKFVPMLLLPPVYAVLARVAERWDASLTGLYLFVLGFFLLMQVAVHCRHARQWYLFTTLVPCMHSQLANPRSVSLRASAFEFLTVAVLYLVVYAVTESLFVLGGALGCGVLASTHYRWARRHPLLPVTA